MLWFARLITLALVAVMADAAVESAHGSASTYAVIAAAALGLGALVLCWARPWIGTAFTALVLFGAFAYATGADPGASPALTGLGSADTAAAIFVFGILAAGIALWRAIPHPVARALAIVLAVYGLAATLSSVQHGGLVAAFGSAPLAWTRGAYVAAEVMLPFAALAALVHAFVLFTRKHGSAGAASLLFAVALAAATQLGAYAAGGAGLATIVAFEHPPATAAQPAPAIASTVADAAGNGSAAASATASPGGAAAAAGSRAQVSTGDAGSGPLFVPNGSGDVSPEVAAAFPGAGKDPQHALASVAALGNDLYPGALGGAIGALRSGSGNSIDKALLLRDVLRSGMPSIATQFAQCTLADTDADALIAQIRSTKAHPKILLQDADGVLATTADPALKTKLQTWASTWKSMVTKAQSEGTKLSGALATAGITLPQAPDAARLRALAANHFWLQANTGGSWVDLDPTIEGAVPGKIRCAPQTVAATLPDNAYDVLGIRITSESSPAAPQSTALLDRTIRTADLGDRDVSIMFAELTGMDTGLTPAVVPAGASAFTPLLRIGSESVTGTPLVLPQFSPGPAAGVGATKGVTAIGGLFDTSATPTPIPAASAPPLPIVSALWLDVSVTAPGTDPTRIRSPIFDRIGFAARAGKSTPAPLAAQPDGDSYSALQTVWNVAVSGGSVASGAGPSKVAPAQDARALSEGLARLNSVYFQLRRSLADDAFGGVVDVAAERPGVSLVAMANDGTMQLDIASDDAVPLTTSEARPLYSSASILAEREILNENAPVPAGPSTADHDALTGFDALTTMGAKIVGLRSGDTSLDANDAVPAEGRARIAAHLANGASVLAMAPNAPLGTWPPYVFWVADPDTGTLRDEDSRGRHPELTERQVEEQPKVQTVPKWKQLACRIGFAIIQATTEDSSYLEGTSMEQAVASAAAKPKSQTSGQCG